MPRLSITLTEPQFSWLKKKARELNITMADCLRREIDNLRVGIGITKKEHAELMHLLQIMRATETKFEMAGAFDQGDVRGFSTRPKGKRCD